MAETRMIDRGWLEPVVGWEQLPDGVTHDDVADVAVAGDGRVFVLGRSTAQVLVYESDGTYVTSWGAGALSARPHGLTAAPDGSLYCVDELEHVVHRFDPHGRLLSTVGTPGEKSDTGHDSTLGPIYDRIATIVRPGGPFNRPTAIAVAPNGHLYVSDGYGNCRVHRFEGNGTHVMSWGEPGLGPGQFHLPHAIVALDDGRLVVADRENERLQLFDLDGGYLDTWTCVQRPCALAVDNDGNILVGELAWRAGNRSWAHGPIVEAQPARLTLLSPVGDVLARQSGGLPGGGPGGFIAPHGLAVDSAGDVYVGEVSATFTRNDTADLPERNTLQKFRLSNGH